MPQRADVGPSAVRMDQQHVAVCLGVGGGAPMDQQQGAGSGELRTLTDVLSGQGFGRVVLGLYVCHVIIIIEGPFCFLRRGAFVFRMRIYPA